jgi:dephospho-CoA kinase
VSHGKPVIGLCGGIGSGKSAVADAFEHQGCQVIRSDELNHAVLATPAVLQQLVDWWGPEVAAGDEPNRRRIADIVFEDEQQKRRLEDLVYPLIAARRRAIMQSVEDNSAIKAIVIDSPLLFESNLSSECNSIVFVNVDEARRSQRLKQSRGWSPDELRRRERWQLALSEKRQRSDFVVDNNGSLAALGPQVADILQAVTA